MSERRPFIDRAALALGRRTSRRDFLSRAAIAGSALAVAPLRFLLRPQSALATIVHPGQCRRGLCTDGFTEFCCTINEGQNSCPPNTYVAGWWKCTDYRGRRLCADSGIRYYIDCNRMPGRSIAGGCQCANADCDNRRVACNSFRYGQCNTDVPGITEVVCRVVVCEHPASIADFHCNATYKQDDRTCGHEAGCLPAAPTERFGW